MHWNLQLFNQKSDLVDEIFEKTTFRSIDMSKCQKILLLKTQYSQITSFTEIPYSLFAYASSNFAVLFTISSKGLKYHSSIYHENDKVNALTFCHQNPEQYLLFICCGDNVIECYDFISKKTLKTISTTSPVSIIISDPLYADILCADQEGRLCSINIGTLEISALYDFCNTITSIIFSDSSTLFISLITGDIITYNLSTSNIANKISLQKPILKLSLRNMNKDSVIPPLLTVVYKNEENVDIYNINDWKLFLHIPANNNNTNSNNNSSYSNSKESQNRKYITFEWVNTFPELLSFIITSSDGVIYTFNILPEWRNRIISPEYQLNFQTRPIFIIHPIHFVEDGMNYQMMVSISMDRSVCVYNMSNYALLYKYTTIGCYTLSIDFNPIIDSCIIGCGDNTMLQWKYSDNFTKLLWRNIKDQVTAVKFFPQSNKLVAFGTSSGMIGVCNINNNNVIYSPMKQGKKSVHTLQWVKTGEDNEENTNYYLYSCGKDNKLLEHHFNNSTKKLECSSSLLNNLNEITSPILTDISFKTFSSFQFSPCFKYLIISIKSYGLLIYGRDIIQNSYYYITSIKYSSPHSDNVIICRYMNEDDCLYVISGTTQGEVYFYRFKENEVELICNKTIDTEKITGIEMFQIKEKFYIAVSTFSGKLEFYEIEDKNIISIKSFKCDTPITSILYIRSINGLCLCGHNQSVQIWNIIRTLNLT